MPSENLRWETLKALKNSPKAKIKYNSDWLENNEDILAGFTEVTRLSPLSEHVLKQLDSNSVIKSAFCLDSPLSDSRTSEDQSLCTDTAAGEDFHTTTLTSPLLLSGKKEITVSFTMDITPSSPPSVSLFSPKATQMAGCICICEKKHRAKAKSELGLRQELQESLVSGVASRESEQLKRFEELMELKQRQEYQSIRDMMEKDFLFQILNLRLREAEEQRLRVAELERQRQLEGRDRLRALNAIQEEVLRLNQLLEPASYTQTSQTLDCISYVTRGNQLCSQVSEVVRATTEGQFPTVEDIMLVERALQEMKALFQAIQKELAQAEKKKKKEQEKEKSKTKESEIKTQQEEQKKTAATVVEKVKAQGSQLKEIFDKIDKLLLGRPVVSGGKSVSTSQHPNGLEFVSYKLAEKFVKQGEEEVASHHEAAFPIAVVASGVWELHPKVGELFLAHLHKKCPYAVPHYPPTKNGNSIEEYQQILGYRVNESGVEGQNSFLKRMSGMIRLYAAIIHLRWPYTNKQGVCGNALMKQYQVQFWKLLLLIKEEYFPRYIIIHNNCSITEYKVMIIEC
ncbi:Nucleoporin GLE1 [Bagarius yarrelli]|uniref:mRNA export factor GLE1 n=1 Tax=Bagarius yarrelli TaxID=175774 RepID=A0A556VUA3_BAGYA|nr:Nucleoporin GLE1 [Bagarius yarrelli]